jgi:hypothetical protein
VSGLSGSVRIFRHSRRSADPIRSSGSNNY